MQQISFLPKYIKLILGLFLFAFATANTGCLEVKRSIGTKTGYGLDTLVSISSTKECSLNQHNQTKCEDYLDSSPRCKRDWRGFL